jgi:hypothetical protein
VLDGWVAIKLEALIKIFSFSLMGCGSNFMCLVSVGGLIKQTDCESIEFPTFMSDYDLLLVSLVTSFSFSSCACKEFSRANVLSSCNCLASNLGTSRCCLDKFDVDYFPISCYTLICD